jgi:hypothetical protein
MSPMLESTHSMTIRALSWEVFYFLQPFSQQHPSIFELNFLIFEMQLQSAD